MHSRRQFLRTSAGGLLIAGAAWTNTPAFAAAAKRGLSTLPAGTLETATLDALTGKVPLIKRSYRPPNFETPLRYFNNVITPNNAFFVRYHLSQIPDVDASTWRLGIGGDAVDNPYELTLDQLMHEFEQVELVAVCQCAGNRRGLSQPHVAGVQWGYGAMGNAKWKGVRLRDILNRAGVTKTALEVVADGADTGPLEQTPDFSKSLPIWKALDENALIAYAMNDAPLPHWNGFPARLVVPGWTGTYWLKHLTSLNVVTQPYKNFWMSTAYRIPKDKFALVDRFVSQETETNTPVTEVVVNSLITNVRDGQRVRLGQPVTFNGIAWDAGYGISGVEVSVDDGKTWRTAELGEFHGRFSFRPFRYVFKPPRKGEYTILAKAINRIGASQTFEAIFNPAGYHHNVVHRLGLRVV